MTDRARELVEPLRNIARSMKYGPDQAWIEEAADFIEQSLTPPEGDTVVRDISGETVCGFRVAAWRETHPEHGDKYGHQYSEHWSTPSNRDPRVKVERLFTEDQLRRALQRRHHETDSQ